MSDLEIKVRVVYKSSHGKRIKLLHVRAEIPHGLKPAGKRICRWHVENKLYRMLKTLVDEKRLPYPKYGFVDVIMTYSLSGTKSGQASLYKHHVESLKHIELPMYPDHLDKSFTLVQASKLSIRS